MNKRISFYCILNYSCFIKFRFRYVCAPKTHTKKVPCLVENWPTYKRKVAFKSLFHLYVINSLI